MGSGVRPSGLVTAGKLELERPRFFGRLWAWRFQPFSGGPFVVDRRLVTQSRMAARGAESAFDPTARRDESWRRALNTGRTGVALKFVA